MASTVTNAPDQVAEPTVRELVVSATADISTLVSDQIELTKTEIKESAAQAGSAFGMIAGAVVAAGLGVIFLLVTIAYVLVAFGLPVWAGFGIVTLFLLIVGAILGLVGKKHAEKVKGPERAIKQFNETKQALSESLS